MHHACPAPAKRLAMAVVSGMIFLLSEKHEKIRSELLSEKKLVTFWLNSCGEDGLYAEF
jgi:hypothetical protein